MYNWGSKTKINRGWTMGDQCAACCIVQHIRKFVAKENGRREKRRGEQN